MFGVISVVEIVAIVKSGGLLRYGSGFLELRDIEVPVSGFRGCSFCRRYVTELWAKRF